MGLAVGKRCKANTSVFLSLSFRFPVDSTKRLNLARRCLSLAPSFSSFFHTDTNCPSNVNFHTIHQEECGASATEGGKQLAKTTSFFVARKLDQIKLWKTQKN